MLLGPMVCWYTHVFPNVSLISSKRSEELEIYSGLFKNVCVVKPPMQFSSSCMN